MYNNTHYTTLHSRKPTVGAAVVGASVVGFTVVGGGGGGGFGSGFGGGGSPPQSIGSPIFRPIKSHW